MISEPSYSLVEKLKVHKLMSLVTQGVLLLKTTKTSVYLKYWQVVSILEVVTMMMMMMMKMTMSIWTLRTKMVALTTILRWATGHGTTGEYWRTFKAFIPRKLLFRIMLWRGLSELKYLSFHLIFRTMMMRRRRSWDPMMTSRRRLQTTARADTTLSKSVTSSTTGIT